MKRHTIAVFVGLVGAAALVSAQAAAQSAQRPQTVKPVEITVTGCLVQGSTPTIFVLDKAKKDPASRTERAVSYVVINQIEDMDLTQFLNHQVLVTGTPDLRVTPERPRSEKELPTFTATAIADVSDTCAEPGR
jgi:hypothetical protein